MSGLPIGWMLIVLIISGVVRSRREIVWLLLGLVTIVKAKRRDLRGVARAVFNRGDRE